MDTNLKRYGTRKDKETGKIMSKISNKIIKALETEIKSQETLLKLLVSQEKNYNRDLTKEKQEIESTIAYYNKVIKDAA